MKNQKITQLNQEQSKKLLDLLIHDQTFRNKFNIDRKTALESIGCSKDAATLISNLSGDLIPMDKLEQASKKISSGIEKYKPMAMTVLFFLEASHKETPSYRLA